MTDAVATEHSAFPRRRDVLAGGSAIPLALLPAMPARATPAREQGLRLLTSWYAEQWPREEWRGELDLMRRAGIGIIRMAEFAWSHLDPSEGAYDFRLAGPAPRRDLLVEARPRVRSVSPAPYGVAVLGKV